VKLDWRSKRTVVALIAALAVAVFAAGMAAAWVNRDNTICKDGKPPKQQLGGLLGQTIYLCHSGQLVTTPG
jgi:vancomycin permeability regulator SanA